MLPNEEVNEIFGNSLFGKVIFGKEGVGESRLDEMFQRMAAGRPTLVFDSVPNIIPFQNGGPFPKPIVEDVVHKNIKAYNQPKRTGRQTREMFVTKCALCEKDSAHDALCRYVKHKRFRIKWLSNETLQWLAKHLKDEEANKIVCYELYQRHFEDKESEPPATIYFEEMKHKLNIFGGGLHDHRDV